MEAVLEFLEKGGEVVYPIMLVIFLMWALLLERLIYLCVGHPEKLAKARKEWSARTERCSWTARQIRDDLLCELDMELNRNASVVRMLISLCPLLGLLGTVTGMIEVFDVMLYLGAGSPKPMAAGISKAILSTVAGMVGAISGLLALTLFTRWVRSAQRRYLVDFVLPTQ